MSVEKLVEHFSALEDPRCTGKVEHRLIDILVIAVCAVIVCAESWDDIALYGRNKLGWLQSFLTLANGIPLHDTFRYRDGCAVCLPCPRQDQALPQHYLARVINLAIHWPP